MATFHMGKDAVNAWFEDNAYVIGKPLPARLNLKAPGKTAAAIHLDRDFFELVTWIPSTGGGEIIKQFKEEEVKYGVYVKYELAFFIVQYPFVNVDVLINIKTIQGGVKDWLHSDVNSVTLLLADKDSNELFSYRTIRVNREVAEKIRDILKMQDQKYKTVQAVNKAAVKVYEQHPDNSTMISETKMYFIEDEHCNRS
jgi:hypothetical protein